MKTTTLLLAALAVLPITQAHAQGKNCDDLRAAIDTRIRAHGGGDFSLAIVDAKAVTAGRVVGSCALGSRKIVLVKVARAADNPGTAVITECDDGRQVQQGPCKR